QYSIIYTPYVLSNPRRWIWWDAPRCTTVSLSSVISLLLFSFSFLLPPHCFLLHLLLPYRLPRQPNTLLLPPTPDPGASLLPSCSFPLRQPLAASHPSVPFHPLIDRP